MVVGITDCLKEDKFQKYADWIRTVAPDAEIAKLSAGLDVAGTMSRLDGLLLTGGGDVHPKFYGMESRTDETQDVNEIRDAFEFEVIDKALDADKPILAVCRGMQIMNVFLGGTLHVDLPKDGFLEHTSKSPSVRRHNVSIVPHSMLQSLNGGLEADVNSFHHQAVDRLGNGLVASSVSEDGVVESVEWALKDGMPFFAAVQWHPERDPQQVLSNNLAAVFLRETQHAVHNHAH